jgi:hypothetical protein
MTRKDITIEALAAAMKRKGYLWFEDDTKEFNLNLVGIRTRNRKANTFDDFYVIAWKYKGAWNLRVYPCTTDPGVYWLRRLLNPAGCAILVPGQYVGVYGLRLHRGKYEALCQTHGPVRVYRDKNFNDILDFDPGTIQRGDFGINHHHAESSGITEWVDSHSAGCQVFQRFDDFVEARNYWRAARARFGNQFTYTLLREEDVVA